MKPTIERNDPERARRYFQDKLAYTTCPTGLAKAMKEGTVRVIDVRAKGDFDKEHLPGSTNLVEGDWPTERGLGRDQVNVLLCYSQTCHLAARAALEFATRGYSVQELEGGFAGWKEHHLPTESGEREPGDALDRTRSMLEARRATEANGPAAAKGTAAAPEAGAEKP
ncbi:MAG TPA: rhodanese-like domain-containing protein [Polyangiaceae bacterium]